jgi:Protein of unknown function (DUF2586)
MGLPALNLVVLDNGLGQALPGNGNTEYVIGGASQGPYFSLLTTTNPNALVTQNGYGPGVELAGFICNSTGNEVAFVAVPLTGGANTAVAATVPGGSTSALTVSGTPSDTYYAKVTVLVAGTIGVVGPQIGISLDAGRTTAFTFNLPASSPATVTAGTTFTTQTGLSLSFAAGTLVVGDSFTWVSTEGVWTDAAISSAINCMLPIPSLIPEDIWIAGGSAARTSGNGYAAPNAGGAYPGTVGVQPGDVVALDGYLTTLFNKRRFNRLGCQAGDALWGGASTESEATWMTSLETNFASSSSLRVGVTAGHYNIISPFSQSQFRRPNSWLAASRDSANTIAMKWGAGSLGALGNVPNSPPPVADGFIYHDEYVNPGLDAARFISLMTRTPKPGWYFSNDNLMAPAGSDFNWFVHGHVIDAACLVGVDFFTSELADSVRVNSAGNILPIDATDLQTRANSALANALTNAGQVSSATCVVSLTDNILQTATLSVTFKIQPLGYLNTIDLTITFVNVAAVVVAGT